MIFDVYDRIPTGIGYSSQYVASIEAVGTVATYIIGIISNINLLLNSTVLTQIHTMLK